MQPATVESRAAFASRIALAIDPYLTAQQALHQVETLIVIMRIWRARIDETRSTEYERFARHESLPMFQMQPGFRGLMFGRSGENCVVITLWEDEAAAHSLDVSPRYVETVARIRAADLSLVDLGVELFDVHGADRLGGPGI